MLYNQKCIKNTLKEHKEKIRAVNSDRHKLCTIFNVYSKRQVLCPTGFAGKKGHQQDNRHSFCNDPKIKQRQLPLYKHNALLLSLNRTDFFLHHILHPVLDNRGCLLIRLVAGQAEGHLLHNNIDDLFPYAIPRGKIGLVNDGIKLFYFFFRYGAEVFSRSIR